MSTRRICIDWAGPVLDGVTDWLLQETDGSEVLDLSSTCVITPTRQSGRRLREALALRAAERDSALIPPMVREPATLWESNHSGRPVAGPLLSLAVWCRVLLDVDPKEYRGLFPAPPPGRDVAWAAHVGELMTRVRSQLVEGGFLIRDVLATHGADLEEPERWQDLERLEALYLQRLEQGGFVDRCLRQVELTSQPVLPSQIGNVVIAAVPDPSLLMIRAVTQLAKSLPVTVLIHCDPNDIDSFDEWGRPLPQVWRDREIPISSPADNIKLGAYPLDQARCVVEAIAAMGPELGPADVAVGVPDSSVAPYVQDQLAANGLKTFNPAGQPINQHRAYHAMMAAQRVLSESATYRQVSQLLRHPDILFALESEGELDSARLLAELDDFQNQTLPQSWADMKRRLKDPSRYPHLAKALEFVERLRAAKQCDSVEAAIAHWAELIYQHDQIDPQTPAGEAFQAVAGRFQHALSEARQPLLAELGFDVSEALELMLKKVSTETYYEDVPEAQVDLEGWLELHWNDAPWLIATGMNDGLVPDTQVSDVFLPDSLLRRLGLRSDEMRLTRDAYLLSAMLASRRDVGRVCLVTGAYGRAGDPLRPSRLLFRCPDQELPERAALLVAESAPAVRAEPASISFKLEATGGQRPEPLQSLGVTGLNAYLRCPYRFYLQYVLRAQSMADDAVELDAMQLGNIAHAAFHSLQNHEDLLADADAMADLFLNQVDSWVVSHFGELPPLPVRVQVEALKRRLVAAAQHQLELTQAGWQPWRYEYACKQQMGSILVKGFLDRVDQHPEKGYRIIDFKTRDKRENMIKTHYAPVREWTQEYAVDALFGGRPRAWQDLQLPIYAGMLRAELGDAPIQVGIFHLPKAVTETGLEVWEDMDETVLQSAWHCATGIVGDIEAGRFWPPAGKLRYEDDFDWLFPAAPEDCMNVKSLVDAERGRS